MKYFYHKTVNAQKTLSHETVAASFSIRFQPPSLGGSTPLLIFYIV